MKFFLRIIFIGFIVFFLIVHLFILAVIIIPVPKMISFTANIDFVPFSDIPEHIKQVTSVPLEYEFLLPVTNDTSFNKLLNKVFITRRNKFFNADDDYEFYLNTLNFGGGIIGISSASNYYFKKSVSELSFEEALMLMNFYEIFRQ